ncbi:MAG: cation transporter [Oscillospiraceae bacterium]|nr:cation transporter [Oscillospiraceae bacterium]
MSGAEREKRIIRTGVIGILANILLAAFKLLFGILSRSIAITLDAVNNASDVLSSAVTVVGTKIAGRPADREHPMGHGRVEYISAQIVSAVILYAGIAALSEAVRKAISPVTPDYSTLTVVMLVIATAVKLALGFYAKETGKKLNSDSLVNSGRDALLDAVISATTLISAVIFKVWGLSLEAWLGILISLVIIKAGIDMFRDTASKLTGERIDSELSKSIKETICASEGVFGAYDLLLNGYGPDRWIGSVNIEVPDTWSADMIDQTCRSITEKVASEYGVILSSVGIYSRNEGNHLAADIRRAVTEGAMKVDHVLEIHGFICDPEAKTMGFHVVTDFRSDSGEILRELYGMTKALYPDYEAEIHIDSDYSD